MPVKCEIGVFIERRNVRSHAICMSSECMFIRSYINSAYIYCSLKVITAV